MLLRPLLLACLAALLAAAPARGGEDKVMGVVELFTSQGCNSCPAADAVLGELAARRDLVALAYHVDYWDYLGWQDTFGSRENSRRQKLYKRALDSRSIYTPQAVLNGQVEMNGSSRAALLRALDDMALAGAAPRIPIRAERRGGDLVIEIAADGGGGPIETVGATPAKQAHLLVVAFGPPTPVTIRDGENGGRTIVYWNPVRRIQPVGLWNGSAERFELPWTAAPGEGAAVLLQKVEADGLPGPILGAAAIRRF